MACMSVRNIQPGSGRWWCVETRRRKWVIIQQFLFQSIRCHRINIVYFDIKLNMRVRMAFAWNICISMLFIDNDWLSNDKEKIITEYPLNFWHLMFDVLCFKCNKPHLTVCYIYIVFLWGWYKLLQNYHPFRSSFQSGPGIITHYPTELSRVVKWEIGELVTRSEWPGQHDGLLHRGCGQRQWLRLLQ